MDELVTSQLNSSRYLVNFIVERFASDGIHLLTTHSGYGQQLEMGFGKYRGEPDCNYITHKNFVSQLEDMVKDRQGYLVPISLLSFPGALPPEDGRIRFSDMRGKRRRYGWLLDENKYVPMSASSLRAMMPKERKTRICSSNI